MKLDVKTRFGAKLALYLYMKNQLKKLSVKKLSVKNLPIKTRYIAALIIAIECASLPAAAQIIQRVSFEVGPRVTAVEIPTPQAGLSRFLVTSNAPFTVQSRNLIGQMAVSVHQSGDINGRRFGGAAQLPGPKTGCAFVSSPASTIIYQAERKTAAKRGKPVEQAIIIQIRYAPETRPSLSFHNDTDKTGGSAQACRETIS